LTRDAGEQNAAELVEVLPQHRFDEAALRDYLRVRLPELADGFSILQFQGGQSNPTFLLVDANRKYVLRKKPPGDLLRGAHQVEREFKVMSALWREDVPVPKMHLLCEDTGLIGTPFFVMDFVEGRLSPEPHLPELETDERKPLYHDMAGNLARLHSVDWQKAGLADFGKPHDYIARQIKTWSRQYEASKTGDMPAMDKLIAALGNRLPEDDIATIVHGDYRPGNMIIAPDRPEVAAILDWELSTLGHPLADLGYFCVPYHLPAGVPGIKGLQGLDLAAAGMPGEDEVLHAYARQRGFGEVRELPFFVAFSLFRLSAILQGVYARALQGNASSADAQSVGARAGFLAESGWAIASRF